jgi:hypothetical protein
MQFKFPVKRLALAETLLQLLFKLSTVSISSGSLFRLLFFIAVSCDDVSC